MPLCGKSLSFAIVLLFGSVQFGFNNGFNAPGMPSLMREYANFEKEYTGHKKILFDIGSTVFTFIGAFLFAGLSLKMPTRLMLSVMSVFNAICWFLFLLTSDKLLWVGIVMKALQGFVTGGFTTIIPCFLIELAQNEMPGFFGSLHQAAVCFGLILFDILGAFMEWRDLIYIAAVCSLLLAGCVWLVPETQHGTAIKNKVKYEFDMPWSKKYINQLIIACVVMAFQQICGIGAILTNLNPTLTASGLEIDTLLQSAVCTSSQLLSTIIAAYVVDAIGRRPMWIFSCAGVALCLAGYAIYVKLLWPSYIGALLMFVYLLFYGLGIGPLPWYLAAVIFPPGTVLFGQASVTFVNCLFSLILYFAQGEMMKKMGEFGLLLLFCVIMIISAVTGGMLIPVEKNQDGERISLL